MGGDHRIGRGEAADDPRAVATGPTAESLCWREDGAPKQGKLAMSIGSSKVIDCLESPFFNVGDGIQQRG